MKNQIAAIILAAGDGKRMRSKLPKVLHACAGQPMIVRSVELAIKRKLAPIVVVIRPGADEIRETLKARFPKVDLRFAIQEVPQGTGDAAKAGLGALAKSFKGHVLLLYGDVPLLQAQTLARLEKAGSKASMALLTAEVDDPTGYGRVIREDGRQGKFAESIVEHKDANKAQREIREINAGVYIFSMKLLREGLSGLETNNAQGEFYLTDLVALAASRDGAKIVLVDDAKEISGVNNRVELAEAERYLRKRLILEHQKRGVIFLDPSSVLLDADVKLGKEVVIGPGVQLYGDVEVGAESRIDGPTFVRNAKIGTGVSVHSFSHIEEAVVKKGASVGPYARLRPLAVVGEKAKVGNFVEMKKAELGTGAKASHLSYIGDAEIGAGSNIGAGTITCN
ncbi:bifunctional UDP-N-acetylglucosamine diphosphorylase/glucosamine-1-phosphate N-acetyltransferase GlmU, partial [Myxococcota bacterium]|nr:bifunctional UDP-N-acetylglucosamine diphosphorylase/glucosamine-1-phosphate N-acetyltransferase GlmU [Myxococcota bacterium]